MSRTNRAQINLRVSDAVADDLDILAEHEHLSRIDVARQILFEGIAERKRTLAARLYDGGRVSASRAAEIAGISLWEWHELQDARRARSAVSAADAIEEVRRIVAEAARA